MSQMRLITDSRDEWTVKELVETLHAKVDDLERKLDAQLKRNEAISWQLHAIILHLTGDRAALTAFVMASEPTVVPNEDEAMPVVEPVIVQDEPSPRKRNKATLWSKMDAQACAFAKAYTQARNEMMQYKVKLDNESLAPSVRAHLQTKYETKRLEQAAHKSEYNKRVAVLQASLTK
jgi:hypothetical protein